MKAELVRTDEEKERYKQLIETNRQRRREVLKVQEKSPNNLPIISRV
jgi:chromatin segregation and condensation protein Rec8/ScpA/Scc1 (kleisin family)